MKNIERFVMEWLREQDSQNEVTEVLVEDFYIAYLAFCRQVGEDNPLDKIRLGQAVWNRLLPRGKAMRHAIRGRFRRLPSPLECQKWFEERVLHSDQASAAPLQFVANGTWCSTGSTNRSHCGQINCQLLESPEARKPQKVDSRTGAGRSRRRVDAQH